jgi:spermidine synthase
MLLHPGPKRVLVIGLGSGVTLGEAGRYPVARLDCAEIDEAVVAGARFFKAYNRGIHDDPRARVFVVDGRNFLLARQEEYDVIISEPSNPWMAGLGYLFTKEFYQLAKRRLAPDGIMCQWLQLYRMFPEDVKLLLKTFHEEFPHMSVWTTIRGDLVLIGSRQPHRVPFEQLARRMREPSVQEGLKVVQADRPEALLSSFLLDTEAVRRVTADTSWVHEDDLPWIEFSAPKALYADPTLLINWEGLARFRTPATAIVPDYASPAEDAESQRALAALYQYRDQPDEARKALERAVSLDPASGQAWRRLGQLYANARWDLRAEDALGRAARADGADVEALRDAARLHWQQEAYAAAEQLYLQAAAVRSPDKDLAAELGRFYQQTKRSRMAAECFRSAVSQGAGEQPALLGEYAAVLRELGELPQAEQALRLALQRADASADLWVRLGELLLSQQRTGEARECFAAALRHGPSAAAHYGLAQAALQAGKPEAVLRHIKQTLRYDPYHREALELMARLNEDQRPQPGS